jgi:Acetyl-coenzyme A synthetase N-terminus
VSFCLSIGRQSRLPRVRMWPDRTTGSWETPFSKILAESNAPFFKWFKDGTLNVSCTFGNYPQWINLVRRLHVTNPAAGCAGRNMRTVALSLCVCLAFHRREQVQYRNAS